MEFFANIVNSFEQKSQIFGWLACEYSPKDLLTVDTGAYYMPEIGSIPDRPSKINNSSINKTLNFESPKWLILVTTPDSTSSPK